MTESNGRFASLCADGCYLGELLRRLLSTLSSNRYLVERDAGLADLVSFKDSERLPVHRWFRYKEGFSPQLVDFMADAFGRDDLGSVLDVFAGVGTTALSVQTSGRLKASSALGIEYNPLISHIASMKLEWWKANPERLRTLAERAVHETDSARDGHMPPAQATLTNDRIFPRPIISAWLALWQRLNLANLSGVESRLARLALLAVAEDVSNARKDGRALRIITRHEPENLCQGHRIVQDAFRFKISAMYDDLRSDWAREARAVARTRRVAVRRGTAVSLRSVGTTRSTPLVQASSINTFVYSPPYLNFIDYTEVYKVESWLGGYVRDEREFRSLREGTIRSHPSIIFPAREDPFSDQSPRTEAVRVLNVLEEFMLRHASSGWHRRSARVVRGYFEDIYLSLLEQRRVAASAAVAACAVGNSLLAQRDRDSGVRWAVTIPTDLIIALLAELAGFRVLRIVPARYLQPRNVRAGASRESLLLFTA